MKEIKLSRGEITMVDDDDFEWLTQWKWYCDNKGYATRVVKVNGKDGRIFMARQIMNAPQGLEVDHIDHNPLNNQKENLRICTTAQNQWNRGRIYGRSKFLGVSVTVASGVTYYKVDICSNGAKYYLGMYTDEEEAAKVYDKKAIELHGEFARLNFK
jgi:hypothetical protein